MTALDKVTVYACPKGAYELDAERAVAWHISASCLAAVGREVNFGDALAIVKNRSAIISMLQEVDAALNEQVAG